MECIGGADLRHVSGYWLPFRSAQCQTAVDERVKHLLARRGRESIGVQQSTEACGRVQRQLADEIFLVPAITALLTAASNASVPSYTSFGPQGRVSFHMVRANSKRRAESFSCRLF